MNLVLIAYHFDVLRMNTHIHFYYNHLLYES